MAREEPRRAFARSCGVQNRLLSCKIHGSSLQEETEMYASLRHYWIEPKNMDELVRRVPGAMEVISKINGFNAYYVVKAGEDTLATVSVFTVDTIDLHRRAATYIDRI